MRDAVKRAEVDEFLAKELERAGCAGVDITRTPLGTRITVYAMRPGLVIGRRGQSIRELTKTLEEKFGLENPQIAVAEVEVPELDPNIMAHRIAAALERGVHFRRVGFWALNRIMSAGAFGAEIIISGKLTTERARYEKYKTGYLPKAGEPAQKYLREAVAHAKLKQGIHGVKVRIMPPVKEFPDTVTVTVKEEKPPSEEVEEYATAEG